MGSGVSKEWCGVGQEAVEGQWRQFKEEQKKSLENRKRVGGDKLKELCELFVQSKLAHEDRGAMIESSLSSGWFSFGDTAHVTIRYLRQHVAGDHVTTYEIEVDVPRLHLLKCTMTS